MYLCDSCEMLTAAHWRGDIASTVRAINPHFKPSALAHASTFAQSSDGRFLNTRGVQQRTLELDDESREEMGEENYHQFVRTAFRSAKPRPG